MVAGPNHVFLGIRHLGVVERSGSECIKTRFFGLLVPIFPLGSVYVLNDRLPCIDGLAIPLHRPSVIAGYLRSLGPIAVGGLLVVSLRWTSAYWWGLTVAVAVAVAVAHRSLGRLSPDEARRRALLREAVGIGAPPEMMQHSLRDKTLRSLRARWDARFGRRAWIVRAEAEGLAAAELVMLHALAELSHQPLLARQLRSRWRACEGDEP